MTTATANTAPIAGLHHVTAISGDPQRNLDFYARALGLRLVKRTVNFDDPTTYHLYYADEMGTPGSVMTFFPWPNAPQGRVGVGQVTLTHYAAPIGSLNFWEERLARAGARVLAREALFAEPRLIALDPDGLPFAIVETADSAGQQTPWITDEIPAAFALRGFHGVTLALDDAAGTAAVLTEIFGYREVGETDAPGGAQNGRVIRFRAGGDGDRAAVVDLHEATGMARGGDGVGTVHHVAFSVPDRAAQQAVRRRLAAAGHHVTPQIDRDYFWAIYFRAPGGVLFEVATDEPGFDRDEPRDQLGQALKLPERYEPARARIEAALPPLTL